MSLLSDISKEQDRISATGQKPIVVWVSGKTRVDLNLEYEKLLFRPCKTVYGMEIRQDDSLPYGVVRLGITLENAQEFLF